MRVDRRAWAAIAMAALLAAGCGGAKDAATPQGGGNNGGAEQAAGQGGGTDQGPDKAADARLHPVVVFETSMGNITVKLDAEKAPLTVDNFLSYVNAKHYDQTIFHQVFKGQGILGGKYGVDMKERPARTPIRNEANNGLKNRRGTIAMARYPDVVDSATCEFFFNVADNESLDHRDPNSPETYGYCVFGQVIAGMDVLDKIANVPVEDKPPWEQRPIEPVILKAVRRAN